MSEQGMNLWWELVNLMSEVTLFEEEDQIIWAYSSSGKYSVQSLYAVVNFRGISPVFVSSIWKLPIPPRVQFFLWLLSKNKLLTQDNLAKRRTVNDNTCLLCSEKESINHLFFEYCVAKLVLDYISELLGLRIGHDFESVARFWLANKKHKVTNTISAAVLWSFWKLRNELCFQGHKWMGLKDVLFKIARMLRRWIPMMQQDSRVRIEEVIIQLERRASMSPQLMWYNQVESSSELAPLGVRLTGSSAATSLQESDVFSGRLEEDLVANMALNNVVLSPSD